MKIGQDTESSIQLEAEFLGFSRKSESALKYVRVSVANREIELKLAKEIRHVLTDNWTRGDLLHVFATTQRPKKVNKPKLKAYRIDRLSCTLPYPNHLEGSTDRQPEKCKLGKISICQKSGCAKRGGPTLYQEIERALIALGLQDRVKIETTGCQKRCKKAPNMVLMPGNRHCSQFSSNSIYPILKEHYDRS